EPFDRRDSEEKARDGVIGTFAGKTLDGLVESFRKSLGVLAEINHRRFCRHLRWSAPCFRRACLSQDFLDGLASQFHRQGRRSQTLEIGQRWIGPGLQQHTDLIGNRVRGRSALTSLADFYGPNNGKVEWGAAIASPDVDGRTARKEMTCRG